MKNDSECRREMRRKGFGSAQEMKRCQRSKVIFSSSFFQLLLSLHYRPHHRRRGSPTKQKSGKKLFLFFNECVLLKRA